MTRAEINTIKARMLDEVLGKVGAVSDDEVMDLLVTQKYVANFLEDTITEQVTQARKQGY